MAEAGETVLAARSGVVYGVRGVKSVSAGLMFSRETMYRWAKDVVFGQIFKRGDYASP